MSRVKIILLCEDKQTDSFVRRFLKQRNFRDHEINTLEIPDGRQSGEQWVRERYPQELRMVRQKQGTFLIVVTDADNNSIEERHEQLMSECERQNIPRRNDNDRVIHVIPRRNIETWFAYLGGSKVDEQTRYPKLNRESECDKYARELYRMCNTEQKLREPAPPSLQKACDEYRKLQR